MKVGILTFHKARNYGAVLQAFALQTVLIKVGVDAYIINRYSGYKSLLLKLYFNFHPVFVLEKLSWKLFDQFSMENLKPKTKKYTDLENFNKDEGFDAVIVGSDQIWRMEFSDIGFNYFLDFISGGKIKKISYAASFGHDTWTENYQTTNHISNLLKDFDSISVREKSGVNICSNIFKVNSIQVLDPTLLLPPENYLKLIKNNDTNKIEDKLTSYILGDNGAVKYCNSFAKQNNLFYKDLYFVYPISKIFSKKEYGDKKYIHLSVPMWLKEINNSKYVITNSYHATIFSILFKKQFITIDHPSGGTDRVISLLSLLGLQSRFVRNLNEITIDLLNHPIDYSETFLILQKEKEKSLMFLKKSIEN
ncbi:MAG: polysaccharide pyruvyl transferase family protein [Mangrovibacterium sp.]